MTLDRASRVFLTSALAVALLAACAGEAPPPPPSPAAVPETVLVMPTVVARERRWDGVVQAVHQATLAAQTAGRVVELPVDVNDVVKAGDVVARFTDVEQRSGRVQADAALRAAMAQAAEAEAEHRRMVGLAARQLVARAQLDQATARRDAARAALAAAGAGAARAGEQVTYTVVRAPYAGLVTRRHVELGETVAPGQPLLSGLSLDRLRVEVQVPQADIVAIREYRTATIRLADGRDVVARDVVVFPAADPQAHTFTVRVELPRMDSGLQPGNLAEVRFKIGDAERLLVPATALVRRGEIVAVHVRAPDGRIGLRHIRTGEPFGDRVEVIAGLAAGEAIILDPLAAMRAQRAVREAIDD
ncbi:MAG TPA: efflux transporter periplasmic adaptor subunit [Xanthomonadaceae bacterium]|jgi:RND family efflux transporter MFP subunit|nr:efflux transporter periplasmic adaptor subunit [Xanthomonadaceae bacterium]